MAHLTKASCQKDAEFEIEEDFHAVMETIKPEAKAAVQFETVYIVSPTPSGNSGISGSEQNLQISETDVDEALCRLCATRGYNLIDIFRTTELRKHIIEQIQYCLPIEVKKNDGLPERACRSCLEKLDMCYQFHKTVTQAEKHLLSFKDRTPRAQEVERYCETASQCRPQFVAVEVANREDFELETASDQDTDDIELIGINNMDQDSRTRNSEELESHENVSDSRNNSSLNPGKRKPLKKLTAKAKRKKALLKKCAQKCIGCKKEFISNESLQAHEDTCKKLLLITKSYSCSHCGQVFAQKGNIHRHMRMHTGEKPFVCDICSKTFISKEGRDNHRRSHTGERPYKCRICGNSFKSTQSLRGHALVHTTDKPYHCFRCDKSYKNRYSRDKHLRTKHDQR